MCCSSYLLWQQLLVVPCQGNGWCHRYALVQDRAITARTDCSRREIVPWQGQLSPRATSLAC